MNRPIHRRGLLLGAAGAAMTQAALGQSVQEAHHEGQYESLAKPGRIALPELAVTQRAFESPAPKADPAGRWSTRAPLPLPRSEMAWAVEYTGKLHLVGGYGEQRVDRAYHQVYDPATDRWSELAPLPRGANHVGVAVLGKRLYAMGGHVEQNRKPHDECFVYEAASDRWSRIAPLPKACGAIGCVGFNDRVHAVGGAVGDSGPSKKSVDWHLAYEPEADRWESRAPLPTGRDHTGTVVVGSRIHVVGGRVDSFHTNSNLHHAYDPRQDRWEPRNPLPTARSGHGAVLYRGRIFVMGGEGTNRVFGQNEAWDPVADRWESFAPMPTPRHGLGAAVVGDEIHVAGGGPVMGGGVQSAVHESFALA